MSFAEDFEALSSGDKTHFADAVNNLLFHCYLVRKKFDRTKGMDTHSFDYDFIERHFSMVEDYLSYIHVVVSKDDDNGVIFVKNEDDKNRERVDTGTTLIVYALRQYYEEQLAKMPNNLEVRMTSNDLRQRLSDLGLSTAAKRLSSATIASALKALAQYNIVARDKNSFADPVFSFYILPTIKYVLSTQKINALYAFLTGSNPASPETEEDDTVAIAPTDGPVASDAVKGPEGF